MLCDIDIELDSLMPSPNAIPFDVMEMRHPTVRGVDHVGEDVGCTLHTGLVILA
jgi:hypothetical protein